MKISRLQLFLSMTMILLMSCTKDKLESNSNKNEFEIKWTAFKYSERFAVSGGFDEITINGFTDNYDNLLDAIENVSVTIDVNSVTTDAELKSLNLINHFFKFIGDDQIIGKVVGRTGNESAGAVQVDLQFNNVMRQVEFDYAIEFDRLKLTGLLNLQDWRAMDALSKLKVCCETYHTGGDGIHLVWPDIKIDISMDMHTE